MTKKLKKDVANTVEGEVIAPKLETVKMRNLVFGVLIDHKEEYTAEDGEKALKAVEKLMQQTRDDPASFASLLLGMTQAPIIDVPNLPAPELGEQTEQAKV